MPRRGSQSPPLINLPLLIIILPTIAILTLLIFAFAFSNFPPRTRGSTTTSVRKSWDSLNVFLVLFAILCGVFARRNDDESSSANEEGATGISSHAPASQTIDDSDERQLVHGQWYSQLSEQKFYEERETTSVARLKRNSSSYPDLRQESVWETGNDRSRFFDDFEISKYRRSPASPVPGNIRRVDTFALNSPPPKSVSPPPPPPPPPPSASANRKPKRIYETIPRGEKEIREVPQPPPPPPPPPPPLLVAEERKSERRNSRKKSNATKEIKSVLTSLYNSQRKRKKNLRMRNSGQRDETAYPPPEQPSFTRPPPSPPPPPPPPPPPSLFHSFFRKGSKSKRIHSLAAPPPPPPPPPPQPAVPMPWRNERASKPAPPPETSKRRSSSGASWRPPLPTTARASTPVEDLDNFGNQSPLIPFPPPPPPPFKVPGFRFVVRGDYVKVRSTSSSLCSSPERDEIETESTNKVNPTRGGPVSCPSPDVNEKADTFIAMLRDGWRMEEKNTVKGRVR